MTAAAAELTGLVQVVRADVYKNGLLAATLTRTGGATVTFAYEQAYLDVGPAVATTLPLDERPVVTSHGAVPPFFAGLLPEGRRLSSLRRSVKTSADDELSLLLAVGRDPVGDVQVVPAGEVPTPAEPLLTVTRSFTEVRFDDIFTEAGVVDAVGLAGVQDKASARVLSLPVAQAGRRLILKVDPPEYPHLVQNEAYFIDRARRAGLPVVSAHVVRDATGRPGLLVERFDRVLGSDGSPRALAVEDAAQLLAIYPADKYRVTAEQVIEAVAAVCAADAVARRDVFRQLCFAWLTGNGDAHAKNVSVLATPTGEWRVAPAYDLPSTLPYRDHTLALPMGGRREGLSRAQLLGFAERVGLRPRAAERVLDQLLAATASIPEELAAGILPFDPQRTRLLVRSVRQRAEAARPAGGPARGSAGH